MHPSLDVSAAKAFMQEDNIPFHEELVFAPCLALAVAESFLQARDRLPESAARFTLDMRRLLEAMVAEVASSDRLVYEQTRDAIHQIAARHGLTVLGQRLLETTGHRPKPPPIAMVPGYNIVHRQHIIDCSTLGVKDIHQAAAVCKTISDADALGFIRDPSAVAMTTLVLAKGLARRMLRRWMEERRTH
jgi:hypothetical protein